MRCCALRLIDPSCAWDCRNRIGRPQPKHIKMALPFCELEGLRGVVLAVDDQRKAWDEECQRHVYQINRSSVQSNTRHIQQQQQQRGGAQQHPAGRYEGSLAICARQLTQVHKGAMQRLHSRLKAKLSEKFAVRFVQHLRACAGRMDAETRRQCLDHIIKYLLHFEGKQEDDVNRSLRHRVAELLRRWEEPDTLLFNCMGKHEHCIRIPSSSTLISVDPEMLRIWIKGEVGLSAQEVGEVVKTIDLPSQLQALTRSR